MHPMDISWLRKPALLGLGLSATLAAAAGCSQGGDTSDAVFVPPPNAKFPTSTAPSTTAAAPSSTGGAAPASTGTAPSAAPVKAAGWGTLKGRVVFGGDPPPPQVLQEKGKAVKDPEICAKDAPILSERLVVDSASKGVRNVFVYLLRPTAVNEEAKKAVASSKVEFDQKGCVFVPHAMAVMTGVPVMLKSSDPTSHNVNFQLKSLQSNQTLSAGAKFEITPSSPERSPGPVSCSIHPWMLSYWMVLDNPYFAVTDEKGNFEIKNVPAGTQKVTVWQEAAGFVTKGSGDDVNIKPDDITSQDFTIDPTKLKPAG
jgi:plastocyanin